MATTDIATDWDVLVIGRSFAGLSAALTLGRARRSVIVVGSGGPRNEAVLHAHGLLTRDGASPSELVATAEQELAKYPTVEIVDDRVLAVESLGADGGFRATVGKRTTTASGLIMATGVNDVLPGIPGFAEHWGRGIFTCPFCDGFEHGDLALGVVGDPAWAPHTATMLTGWTDDVTVFGHEFDTEVADGLRARGVTIDPREVTRVVGDGSSVSAVELADGSSVAVGAIFSARLPIPNNQLAVSLGCELDQFGFVTVDAMQSSTVPGVWAAGDVSGMRHQMAFAIANGVTAASAFIATKML